MLPRLILILSRAMSRPSQIHIPLIFNLTSQSIAFERALRWFWCRIWEFRQIYLLISFLDMDMRYYKLQPNMNKQPHAENQESTARVCPLPPPIFIYIYVHTHVHIELRSNMSPLSYLCDWILQKMFPHKYWYTSSLSQYAFQIWDHISSSWQTIGIVIEMTWLRQIV